MISTWNSQRDLRKGEMTMFGNYKKPSMELCKEPIIGQKTWTKPFRVMDTANHMPILKSDQEFMATNLH